MLPGIWDEVGCPADCQLLAQVVAVDPELDFCVGDELGKVAGDQDVV